MKKIIAVLILSSLVVACGSKNPLERGAKSLNGAGGSGGQKPTDPNATYTLNKDVFITVLLPAFTQSCDSCHGNKTPDFDTALKFVVMGSAENSLLYQRATGTKHKSIWKVDSAEAAALASWINTPVEVAAQKPTTNEANIDNFSQPISDAIHAIVHDAYLLQNPDAPTEPTTSPFDKGFFETNLLPSFIAKCDRCHDNPAPDFDTAIKHVVFGEPNKSELYLKATGADHKPIWKTDSAEAATLASWINGAKQ